MALVGLLRTEGPLTATRAGELLGESSGTCSLHLRQLAKYGLVEEAGGGTGREKPWRATTTSTDWDAIGDGTPESAAATGLLASVIAGGIGILGEAGRHRLGCRHHVAEVPAALGL